MNHKSAVKSRFPLAAVLAALAALPGCKNQAVESPIQPSLPVFHRTAAFAPPPDPLAPIIHPQTAAERIVNGAKAEVRRGVVYDASYAHIAYPGGDVSRDRGACTDVVIRSLRNAGYDLQELIHRDMGAHFHLYPRKYGNPGPDSNIDHRRALNQMTFFRRFGRELPRSTQGQVAVTWQPGDTVYWALSPGVEHCGILSNVRTPEGIPLVIHNLGRTAQENCLTAWPIIGHFRYPNPNHAKL